MKSAPETIARSRVEQDTRPPTSRRSLRIGGALGGSVLVAALLAGTLPRMAQRHRLAAAGAVVGRSGPPPSVTTVGPAPARPGVPPPRPPPPPPPHPDPPPPPR